MRIELRMKTTAYLLLMSFAILSCNQKRQEHAELEKEYIENLEEKNRILEQELKELKQSDGSKVSTNRSASAKEAQPQSPKAESSPGYFTIGSTEEEVLDVMGDPTSLHDLGSNDKIFNYGSSSIDFRNGRVKSYYNGGKNLKVRVRR
jgi:hypothetical protein